MPSLRVFSDTTSYSQVEGSVRRSVSRDLRAMAAEVLGEDPSGIEAFWMAPFDKESAENTLPYWVDVELSATLDDDTITKLAKGVLRIVFGALVVPCGVWIKTPARFHWDETQSAT